MLSATEIVLALTRSLDALAIPYMLVGSKLRWSMAANRAKDIEDVRGVLASQVTSMNLAYVRHWCDVHQTRELLESMIGEIGGEM